MNEPRGVGSRSTIDRNEWQRLSALLDEGLELDEAARAAWLEGIRATEPTGLNERVNHRCIHALVFQTNPHRVITR